MNAASIVMSASWMKYLVLQTEPGHSDLLMIFVGIAAISLAIQALVFIGLGVGGFIAQREARKYLSELHGKAMPLITQSHALVNELSPQIKAITLKVEGIAANVDRISAVAKQKVEEFGPTISAANETVQAANETVREANRKAAAQVSRVNGMVSTALDATAQIGATIHHGIKVPAREMAGVVSGMKAAIDTFFSGARAFGSGTRFTPPRPVITRYRSMAEEERHASSGLHLDKKDLSL